MCGIIAIVGLDEPEPIYSLNSSLYHRGPDEAGEYFDPAHKVGLAMRRLSILDLEGGHQPQSNEDDTVWIVFNGEIYNAPELRPELEDRGHRFKTSHSDTECLLHLYEEYGPAMVSRLNGMFAFIIYDKHRRKLFGARDRFGIKPLYYTKQPGKLVLASELKAFLQLPSISRDVDPASLYHYLSLRYVPGTTSIFRDIKRVPPAHSFEYSLDTQQIDFTCYWTPPINRQEDHSLDEWVEIIQIELRDAVKRWVLSDVPIACSLSGGLDSSAIVSILSDSNYPQVRTYSLGFGEEDESKWNELMLARQVAKRWDTDHHEIVLNPETLLDDLMQMVWALDEPYGGGLPSWYVFRMMAQDVKVGLTGTGGDELFGGYAKWRFYEQRLRGYNPQSPVDGAKRKIRVLGQYLPAWIIGARRKSEYAALSRSHEHPMDDYKLYFDDVTKESAIISFAADGFPHTSDWLQQRYDAASPLSVRNGYAAVDMQSQLPDEFLLMTDRFSMTFSLEARVPFLDHIFVERVLAIPPDIRMKPHDPKYLFRRAVAPLLPPDLLNARKRGFVLPNSVWLRGSLRPLVERLLSPEHLKKQGLIQPSFYRQFVLPHLEGKRNNAEQIWTLLMFQLWHKVFCEDTATSAPSYTWSDLS